MDESVESEVIALQRSIFRCMTPAQRWDQAVKLRHMAWETTKAGIRMRQPGLTEEGINSRVRNVFLHATT